MASSSSLAEEVLKCSTSPSPPPLSARTGAGLTRTVPGRRGAGVSWWRWSGGSREEREERRGEGERGGRGREGEEKGEGTGEGEGRGGRQAGRRAGGRRDFAN
eukprot:278317-Hanusia_phi.AAC.2